jgi:hypothetical protein
MVQMEFHFFYFIFKMNRSKITARIDFQYFFNGVHFSLSEIHQILQDLA